MAAEYHLIPVTFLVTGAYLLSWYMVAEGRFSEKVHRQVWNVVLLVSFAITAFLGLVLTVRESTSYKLRLPSDRFWHVEFGLVMIFAACLHIYWHWSYFRRMAAELTALREQ